MLTSVRSLLAATVLASAALTAAPAMAQDEPESDITVTGNVSIVSDYRFRGVSLSAGDPAIQGGLTIGHKSGFYIGTWASSLEDTPVYGEMEMDLFAGWKGEVTSNLTLDVGLTYYAYPSKDNGAGPSDYFEPYAKLSTTIGPVGATLGVAYAWDQDALGDQDNLYIFTDLSVGIPNTPISLTGHLGYSDGVLALDGDQKTLDWSVGASVTALGGLTLGVSYVGVQGPSFKNSTDDAIVVSLGYSF